MIIRPWPESMKEPTDQVFRGILAAGFRVPPRIIYHYASIETAKLIIGNSTLKFSQPGNFNDPFDIYEGIVTFDGTTRQQVRDYIKLQYGYTVRGDTRDKRRVLEKEILENDAYKTTIPEAIAKMKEPMGICCFSKIADQTLMWSHYADRHKGVCLGFSIQPYSYSLKLNVWEVNYPDRIIPVSFFNDYAIRHLLLTKMNAWAYEQEVRAVIADRKEETFFKFDKACLREIYFGYSTPQEEIDEIIQLLRERNYKEIVGRRMVLDSSTFSLKASEEIYDI